MTVETLIIIRKMLFDFGAPIQYWTGDQLLALSELEAEILRLRCA